MQPLGYPQERHNYNNELQAPGCQWHLPVLLWTGKNPEP